MDSIQIIIKTGVDEANAGGTTLDQPVLLLPEGTVDELLEAFEHFYGLYSRLVANPDFDAEQPESPSNPSQVLETVTPVRNFSVRLRKYVEEIYSAHAKSVAEAAAAEAAQAAAQQKLASLSVVDPS